MGLTKIKIKDVDNIGESDLSDVPYNIYYSDTITQLYEKINGMDPIFNEELIYIYIKDSDTNEDIYLKPSTTIQLFNITFSGTFKDDTVYVKHLKTYITPDIKKIDQFDDYNNPKINNILQQFPNLDKASLKKYINNFEDEEYIENELTDIADKYYNKYEELQEDILPGIENIDISIISYIYESPAISGNNINLLSIFNTIKLDENIPFASLNYLNVNKYIKLWKPILENKELVKEWVYKIENVKIVSEQKKSKTKEKEPEQKKKSDKGKEKAESLSDQSDKQKTESVESEEEFDESSVEEFDESSVGSIESDQSGSGRIENSNTLIKFKATTKGLTYRMKSNNAYNVILTIYTDRKIKLVLNSPYTDNIKYEELQKIILQVNEFLTKINRILSKGKKLDIIQYNIEFVKNYKGMIEVPIGINLSKFRDLIKKLPYFKHYSTINIRKVKNKNYKYIEIIYNKDTTIKLANSPTYEGISTITIYKSKTYNQLNEITQYIITLLSYYESKIGKTKIEQTKKDTRLKVLKEHGIKIDSKICQKIRQPEINLGPSPSDPDLEKTLPNNIRITCKEATKFRDNKYPGYAIDGSVCCFQKKDQAKQYTGQYTVKGKKTLNQNQKGNIYIDNLNIIFNNKIVLDDIKTNLNDPNNIKNEFLRFGIIQDKFSFINSVINSIEYTKSNLQFLEDMSSNIDMNLLKSLNSGDLIIKFIREPKLLNNFKHELKLNPKNKKNIENTILNKYKEYIQDYNNYNLIYDLTMKYIKHNIFIFDILQNGNIDCIINKDTLDKSLPSIFLLKKNEDFEPIYVVNSFNTFADVGKEIKLDNKGKEIPVIRETIQKQFKHNSVISKQIFDLHNFSCRRKREIIDELELIKPLTLKKFITKISSLRERASEKLNIYGQYIDIYNKVTYVIIEESNIKYLYPIKPSMIVNDLKLFDDLDEFKTDLTTLMKFYEKFKNDPQFEIQGQVIIDERAIALILNNGLIVPINSSKISPNLKKIDYNYFNELDSAIFYGSTREGVIQTKNINRIYKDIIFQRVRYEISLYLHNNSEILNKIADIIELDTAREDKFKKLKPIITKVVNSIIKLMPSYQIPKVLPNEFISCKELQGDVFCKNNMKFNIEYKNSSNNIQKIKFSISDLLNQFNNNYSINLTFENFNEKKSLLNDKIKNIENKVEQFNAQQMYNLIDKQLKTNFIVVNDSKLFSSIIYFILNDLIKDPIKEILEKDVDNFQVNDKNLIKRESEHIVSPQNLKDFISVME